jgi:hypothetical protein
MRRVWHEIYEDKSPIACGAGRVNAVSSSHEKAPNVSPYHSE